MKSFYAQAAGVAAVALYFLYCATHASDWHFIDNVDLIFHEAGHTIFSFFGEFTHVAMGSGFQILLPLALSGYFFYTQQQLSGSIALMWTGYNIVNVSVYAADASAMQLPLLGGDASGHDWNYLLGALHLLDSVPQVSGTIYALGFLAILLGLALAMFYIRFKT